MHSLTDTNKHVMTSLTSPHYSHATHPVLHSFPTRRSSDLTIGRPGIRALAICFCTASSTLALEPARTCPCCTWPSASVDEDRKSTRLNSSHVRNLVCRLLLEKKKRRDRRRTPPTSAAGCSR